jgi:predicted ribosomally synthesized peptide with SipW-like signal peptide
MKKNEAKKRKKKIMLISTLATAALIVGGLTFAWYTSQDSVTNTFKTSGNLKTVVVENFTPPTNWQPGVTTDKVVQVTNTGTLDAYTRVKLDEILTFYKKGEEYKLDGTNDVAEYSATAVPYIQVDAEAIEKTVAAWNAENTDSFVKLASEDDYVKYGLSKAIFDKYGDNLVVYVKDSDGTSKDADNDVVENGRNYEYLAYYDTKLTDATEENTTIKTTTTEGGTSSDNVNAAKKICYEVDVEAIVNKDTQNTNTTNNAKETNITHTTGFTLTLSLVEAVPVVVDSNTGDNKLTDYIELEFNKAGDISKDNGNAESDWYFNAADGYYYYRGVLTSGKSTTPLLKAVRMRETIADEIYNATYNLTVVSESIQANSEAAVDGAWKTDSNDVLTNCINSEHSNLKNTADTSKCEYTDNDTEAVKTLVCSLDLEDVIGSGRTHNADLVAGARQTAANATNAVTSSTDSNANKVEETQDSSVA